LDALSQSGISPSIEKFKKDLYNYYRLLRNDVAHCLNQDYEKEYKAIDKIAIAAFTRLSTNQRKNHSCRLTTLFYAQQILKILQTF